MAKHSPILLIDVAGFTAEYRGTERKRALLKALQEVLTDCARFFMPFGDPWSKWNRHGTGDGYYMVLDALPAQVAFKYALEIGGTLVKYNCVSPDIQIRLRMVIALGDVEKVEDQLLSETFGDAERFISHGPFKQYAEAQQTPTALAITDLFHHELERELREACEFEELQNVEWTPIELRDKHDQLHRGYVFGTGWGEFEPDVPAPPAPAADPTKYLEDLREATGHIDIRGLGVGSGKAHRFAIDALYIELKMTGGEAAEPDGRGGGRSGQVPLHAVLQEPRVVVIGDPGAGKTTFLNWVAWTLSGDRLGVTAGASPDRLGLQAPLMPVLVRIAEWLEHLGAAQQLKLSRPTMARAAEWLPHYLEARARDAGQGLDAHWFRARLEGGEALLLLDGLDETADRREREQAVALIEYVARAFRKTSIVVTSRPVVYADKAVLGDFHTQRIEPLGDPAVEAFLTRWSEALHQDNPTRAGAHRQELLSALSCRPNIRRLARNTVMLTALAVVHWNEKRLPEQRADLYESILTWLARSRQDKPGRASAERCLAILRELALAMQRDPEGRRIQVPRHWAAEAIAGDFGDADDRFSVDRAEGFLEQEELDSGIVVRRGNELRFWHLTFQEYLAARAVAGRGDVEQRSLLLDAPRHFFAPEWREVVLLFAGVLHGQGRAKVDGLVAAVLGDLYEQGEPGLASQAATAGLLGALVRDLAPFDYTPADARYRHLMDAVMGVFEAQRAGEVPVTQRIEAAEALGAAGDPRLEDEVLRWVQIPAGEFLMGAQASDRDQPSYDPEAYEENETPPHRVALDAFRISRWPVTVAEYARFVEDEGYGEPRWWSAGGAGNWEGPDEWDEQTQHSNWPVVNVSWLEAQAYCAWLTHQRRSLGLAAEDEVARLPTEAQWEYAARGRETRLYPWGDALPDAERLNFGGNVGRPTPVGVYPTGNTPEGVLDMGGNVLEWCTDWFSKDYYGTCARQAVTENPTGPKEGKSRVLRGGAWGDVPRDARAAYRGNSGLPEIRNDVVGFRVLLLELRQD